MASITFNASILEVTTVHFRDAVLHSLRPLTRALKAMFVSKFGEADWLWNYHSFLTLPMRSHAKDDGSDFDMCEFNCVFCVLQLAVKMV
jgi:hypothetical protein